MYKKNITFKDFDGNVVTEPFYFNLTQAEVVKLESRFISKFGMSISDSMLYAGEKHDFDMILSIMEMLIGAAYGERVGNKFTKTPEITMSFMSSEAYSSLLFDLIENEKDTEFFTNVMPDMKGLRDRINALATKTLEKQRKEQEDQESVTVE